MTTYSEYEIVVLGQPNKQPRRNKKWLLLLLIAGIAIGGLVYLLWEKEEPIDIKDFKTELKTYQFIEPEVTSKPEITSGVEYEMQVVNDVWLNVFFLKDMEVELTTDISAYRDSTECFIVQAADIRKDNGKFIGDFILNGEKLSSGKRREGYCAIINGEVTIGMSNNNEVVDECIAQNGSLFRQHPLVINKKAQNVNTKGKSIRLALAQNDEGLYIIMTEERESIHNFSEALVDLDMNNALSLVGGNNAYVYWKQDDESYESHDITENNNPNFIVFKRKNN